MNRNRVVSMMIAAVLMGANAPEVPLFSAAPNENCGVQVNYPHVSRRFSAQIHTRVESFCRLGIVESNQVSASSFRSRWYGWERMGGTSDGPKATNNLRITVAIDCVPETRHRWRTEARGVIVMFGRTYTAAAYEESIGILTCRR